MQPQNYWFNHSILSGIVGYMCGIVVHHLCFRLAAATSFYLFFMHLHPNLDAFFEQHAMRLLASWAQSIKKILLFLSSKRSRSVVCGCYHQHLSRTRLKERRRIFLQQAWIRIVVNTKSIKITQELASRACVWPSAPFLRATFSSKLNLIDCPPA